MMRRKRKQIGFLPAIHCVNLSNQFSFHDGNLSRRLASSKSSECETYALLLRNLVFSVAREWIWNRTVVLMDTQTKFFELAVNLLTEFLGRHNEVLIRKVAWWFYHYSTFLTINESFRVLWFRNEDSWRIKARKEIFVCFVCDRSVSLQWYCFMIL